MIKVGFIWDIDGVVLDSPHEEAWRITVMKQPWGADGLTSDFYFAHVASRPRYEGGNNILELKGIYKKFGAKTPQEKRELLEKFCNEKNALIRDLIKEGRFKLFSDAVNLLLRAKKAGILQSALSASKNANDMLIRVSKMRIIKEVGDDFGILAEKDTLFSIFDFNACGLDVKGKVEMQKSAMEGLRSVSGGRIEKFVVFEDAPSGVEAAKKLGSYAVGVLRIGSKDELKKAGADIVIEDLRTIEVDKLINVF